MDPCPCFSFSWDFKNAYKFIYGNVIIHFYVYRFCPGIRPPGFIAVLCLCNCVVSRELFIKWLGRPPALGLSSLHSANHPPFTPDCSVVKRSLAFPSKRTAVGQWGPPGALTNARNAPRSHVSDMPSFLCWLMARTSFPTVILHDESLRPSRKSLAAVQNVVLHRALQDS